MLPAHGKPRLDIAPGAARPAIRVAVRRAMAELLEPVRLIRLIVYEPVAPPTGFGSDTGGTRAAAIGSLIATARLNGLNPEAYLRHVLGCVAEHPVKRIDDLLPWNCANLIRAAPADRLAA